MWNSGSRPWYSLIMVKEGLVTALVLVIPNPWAIPLVSHVLPAPSSPCNVTTSPPAKISPRPIPRLKVSTGFLQVMVIALAMCVVSGGTKCGQDPRYGLSYFRGQDSGGFLPTG